MYTMDKPNIYAIWYINCDIILIKLGCVDVYIDWSGTFLYMI